MTYPNGIHATVLNEEYHADPALSVSGAKLLLPPSCPALFKHNRDNGRKPKKVWDFGTLAHALVLGKGSESIVVVDAADWRTKAAQEARDGVYAKGQTPVLPKDMEVAQAMAAEVLNHPVAGPLFAGDGMAEHSLFWDDEATGVRLRARPDWITADGGALVDYKTSVTANPAELERKWHALGYFIQHAWYVDGFTAATGADEPDFVFVAQEKEPPYLVSVIRYDAEAVAEGRRLARQAITTYTRCLETDTWPAYTDVITSLSLPRWATRDGINPDAAALIAELEGITA